MLLATVVTGGQGQPHVNAATTVEKSTSTFASQSENLVYTNIDQKSVKIGNYYYRVKEITGELQRKKTGDKNYKTIVKSVYGRCLATKSKIYYMKPTLWENDGYCEIYKCNINGSQKTKIKKLSYIATLGSFYDKKLYVSTLNPVKDTVIYSTYAIANYGKGKISKVMDHFTITGAYKQYLVGIEKETVDDAGKIYIYNAKTKKKTYLCIGCKPNVYGTTIYYAVYDKKNERYVIKRCSSYGRY